MRASNAFREKILAENIHDESDFAGKDGKTAPQHNEEYKRTA